MAIVRRSNVPQTRDAAEEANSVKFFFAATSTITMDRREKLVKLAYETARSLQAAPKEIFVRSDLHNTTMTKGRPRLCEDGWHATISFKDESQVQRQFHITSHGCTSGKLDYELVEATHFGEKSDLTRKHYGTGGLAWPPKDELVEYMGPFDFSFY